MSPCNKKQTNSDDMKRRIEARLNQPTIQKKFLSPKNKKTDNDLDEMTREIEEMLNASPAVNTMLFGSKKKKRITRAPHTKAEKKTTAVELRQLELFPEFASSMRTQV